METAILRKVISNKTCAFIGCGNTFKGSQFQRYCRDERCISRREDARPPKKKMVDKDADNRIINKATIKRVFTMNRKVLSCKCKAKTATGNSCGKVFKVVLESRRTVYPKFCKEHRNAYKRQRYLVVRSI